MSMFWSGDMLLGCKIEKENIDFFLKSYIKKNPKEFEGLDAEQAEDQMYDYLWCSEELGESDATFCARYFSDDTFEGIYFQPANPENTDYYQVTNDLVFVSANKWLSTRCIFNEGFYNSFAELKEEFIEKIGDYLPKDFDYDNNIGDLSYACFA